MEATMKRRLQLRINKLRMRTSRIGRANQIHWNLVLAEKLFNKTQLFDVNGAVPSGRYLFNEIPPDMCEYVTNTWFDPYNRDMTREQVVLWLWSHAIHDPSGHIIAIHDRGEIKVYAEGWRNEAEWFGFVKIAEWNREAAHGRV